MLLLLSPALALAQGVELKTDYSAERSLLVRCETVTDLETTDFSMERDGEPFEGRGGGGGGSTSSERVVVYVDTVRANEEGAPTQVARAFDEIELTGSAGFGERSFDFDREGPLEGETLILTLDDGDVVAEIDGGEPDDPAVLEGHSLTLPLDGLLPDEEVQPGDSWNPAPAGLAQAILVDVEGALFPPEPRGEGGERGGRGGFRGGRGSRTGFLKDAQWEVEATLAQGTEDVDGIECVVIELECEAEGDLPEPRFGRGRRERAFGPALLPALPGERATDNVFEVSLEGRMWFSVVEKRPVQLELEGAMTLETHFEGEFNGSTFSRSSTQEGEIEITVKIEEAGL